MGRERGTRRLTERRISAQQATPVVIIAHVCYRGEGGRDEKGDGKVVYSDEGESDEEDERTDDGDDAVKDIGSEDEAGSVDASDSEGDRDGDGVEERSVDSDDGMDLANWHPGQRPRPGPTPTTPTLYPRNDDRS